MTEQKSLSEAIEELEAEGAAPRQRTEGEITSLPLNNISKRTAVFQPRTLDGYLSEDEEFTNDLVRILKQNDGKPLDPITVWFGGRNFYVIDGHHRLEAYRRYWRDNKTAVMIPCEEFTGTLQEAMEFAGRANCKNKLPMKQVMRLNFAWRLVCTAKRSCHWNNEDPFERYELEETFTDKWNPTHTVKTEVGRRIQ